MASVITTKKGFTLIEMLISVFIFALVMSIAGGLFAAGISSQRKTLERNQLLNESSYALEYMSRALRMARKDDLEPPDCLSGTKVNYEDTGNGIRFKNYNKECQEFYLSNARLYQEKNGVNSALTSSQIEVTAFRIEGQATWDQDDTEQPRVTFFLEVKPKGKENPKLKLQTTLSQRNLDVAR